MVSRNKRRFRAKKILRLPGRLAIVSMVVLLVIVLAALAIWKWDRANNPSKKEVTSTADDQHGRPTNSESEINYNPPTDDEKQAAEEHKEQLAEQKEPSPASNSVTPIITFAGVYGDNIEVSSYISGIIEEGGTCTLTATLGSQRITKEVTGLRNARNTSCPTFEVSRSEFASPGTWTVKVSYRSVSHSGMSTSQTIKVQ